MHKMHLEENSNLRVVYHCLPLFKLCFHLGLLRGLWREMRRLRSKIKRWWNLCLLIPFVLLLLGKPPSSNSRSIHKLKVSAFLDLKSIYCFTIMWHGYRHGTPTWRGHSNSCSYNLFSFHTFIITKYLEWLLSIELVYGCINTLIFSVTLVTQNLQL